ncbi:MAG: hypothetical protein K2X29_08085, partial [Candidatus Obscuribacterales bacterium]|nr:hypothetical protein [Candidatus Obscuribacterales bacterium]
QVLNHASNPTTVDQGSHPTCNVATVEHRLYSRHPELVAQMVADAALNGNYVTASGANIALTRLPKGIKPELESQQSLKLQRQRQLQTIKVDGARDWSSQLVQTILVNSRWHNEDQVIAGDRMLPLYSLKSDEHGHTYLPNKGGNIALFDAFGKPLSNLLPGETAFDKDGKEAVARTLPGEINYGKVGQGPDAAEYIQWRGRKLRNEAGKLSTSPIVFASQLPEIERQVTGTRSYGFVLEENTHGIKTPEDLAKVILTLKDEHNLPGVLRVHTAHRPFSQLFGFESVLGVGGGWHVINFHDYDPVTRRVKITNQWGSDHDYLEKGLPIEMVFKSMRTPPDTTLHKIYKLLEKRGK